MCYLLWIDSEGPNRKKKRRSQPNNKRQRSLSPLSKRMEMLGAPEAGSRTHNSQFNHPYGYQPPPPPVEEVNPEPQRSQADIDYEFKVCYLLKVCCKIYLRDTYKQKQQSESDPHSSYSPHFKLLLKKGKIQIVLGRGLLSNSGFLFLTLVNILWLDLHTTDLPYTAHVEILIKTNFLRYASS